MTHRLETQRRINRTLATIDAVMMVKLEAADQLDVLARRLETLKMLQAEQNTEFSLHQPPPVKFLEIA